jgi:signal transduction histidine kinase
MKGRLRWKLTLSFLVIFALFTLAIVFIGQSQAHRYRTEALRERLDAYSQFIIAWIAQGGVPDGIAPLLPSNLRITWVGKDGNVLYDNLFAEPANLENRSSRPEIVAAREHGSGSEIRTSATTGQPYLYYALHYGDGFVRVALPYDIQVRDFLKSDNGYLYLILALFIVGLLLVYIAGTHFEKSAQYLRERRLKHEMTGNIAHELRTPVTSIRGFLETVLESQLPPEVQRNFLTKAYSQTLNLSELIRDMGLLTKIEERPGQFAMVPVDLRLLFDRVVEDLQKELVSHRISVMAKLGESPIVLGNENLLYSVFRNLLDNAIRHAGEGVTVTIYEISRRDGRVYLSFADNGAGLADRTHRARLFERFYRVDEGRTRDGGGSGLGLSIVKNAVRLHGSAIEAASLPTRGLEFTFSLPLAGHNK